jgi:hypothetical protein
MARHFVWPYKPFVMLSPFGGDYKSPKPFVRVAFAVPYFIVSRGRGKTEGALLCFDKRIACSSVRSWVQQSLVDFRQEFWPGTIVGISAPQARIVVDIIAAHFRSRSSGILGSPSSRANQRSRDRQ